ncbi:hypothetical protein C8F04DRAFT_386390 [Mycena alexandri]|uniref:Acyl-coenzyme A oxidase N-terminal domain-containing protein n=1 Tax=Mycena alexandri TaxID=1745969 RepID=A0AAD6T218_9AGAR|nr:hypothetical protein C8F04DRAFT_386390 [Mycena alexandri]
MPERQARKQASRQPNSTLFSQTRLIAPHEGQRVSFNSRVLTNIIYGGPKAVALREAAFSRVEKTLKTADMSTLPDIYRELHQTGHLMDGVRLGRVMLEGRLHHGHSVFNFITPQYCFSNVSPFGLHVFMFIPVLPTAEPPGVS